MAYSVSRRRLARAMNEPSWVLFRPNLRGWKYAKEVPQSIEDPATRMVFDRLKMKTH